MYEGVNHTGDIMFSGKRLLITGGTGSFGNAVLRRFLKTDIARDPHLQPRRKEAG